nr:hypothetical protein KitaXyl93_76050 [Kitasatospora sp. Xyl93]
MQRQRVHRGGAGRLHRERLGTGADPRGSAPVELAPEVLAKQAEKLVVACEVVGRNVGEPGSATAYGSAGSSIWTSPARPRGFRAGTDSLSVVLSVVSTEAVRTPAGTDCGHGDRPGSRPGRS